MRVVLLTNILNPFRIFFYDKLRDEYAHHNVDFRVLVMVPNEPGRTWQYDDFRRDYTTLMKGGLKKVSGIDVIINPGIGRVIKKMNPDVMVCAGMEIPTVEDRIKQIDSLFFTASSAAKLYTAFIEGKIKSYNLGEKIEL